MLFFAIQIYNMTPLNISDHYTENKLLAPKAAFPVKTPRLAN